MEVAGPLETPLGRGSVQFSCSVMSDSLRPHELQHARPPCPSPTPGVHTVKGFGIVNKAEIDVSPEFSCFFFNDPADVGNLTRLRMQAARTHLCMFPLVVKDREAWSAAVHGVTKSQT